MSQYSKKARKWMSPLEIKAIAGEMNSRLSDLNINTVYDINRRLYVIKLSKTDCKEFIVIESGVRVHLTEYNREKSDSPNNFTSKLRKYLNKKRLIKVNQIGNDRVVEIVFGNVTERYSLLVDLYSNGNICLCDQNYTILLSLRSFTFEKTGDKVAVGEKYPMHLLSEANGIEDLKNCIKDYDTLFTSESTKTWTLKQLINSTSDFGQQLSDHCCNQFGKEKSRTKKIGEFNEEEKKQMKEILEEAIKRYENIDGGKCKGYIFYHETNNKKFYEEVSCDVFFQDNKRNYLEFDSFGKAMDEFHSNIEKQEYEAEVEKKEMIVKKKVQSAIDGHQKRYQGLLDKAELLKKKAEAVEANIKVVDQLIDEINVFLKEKMKWEQIEGIIEQLKETVQDSIAHYVKKFDFKNEVMVLMLKHPSEEVMDVEISLSKNGFENVRNYYDTRKNVLIKAQKTIESKDIAIKQAENKQERVAKENKITLVDVKKMRKRFWFEKFHWFLSSENFVIISGKDALQNDVMYRRYMKKTDIYVHADIHGAASCLIKGVPGKVIGAPTLEQAGKIAVCRSSAWASKIVTSAWWVYSDQVSKTAPSGEYLVTGSFMIRGKKNYLPPVPLVFGIGIMFAVEKDDETKEIEGGSEIKEGVVKEEMKEEIIKEETNDNVIVKKEEVPVEVEQVAIKNIEVKEKEEGKVTIEEIQFEKVEFSSKKEEEEARIEQRLEKKKRMEQRKEAEEKKKKEKEERKKKEEEKKGNKAVRGKNGKSKKLKKYEEQDDEDKKKMEERIGHAFELKKEEEKKVEEKKDVLIQCFVCGSTEHIAKDCPIKKEELKKKLEQKVKEELEEEDEDEEMAVNDTIFVEELKQGMNVKYAVPVCGPYECVSKYKYHLKLTPGSTKAGKAIKSIVGLWQTWKDQTDLEKALISGITTDEYVGVMMSDVAVHPPTGKIKTQKWKGGSGKQKKPKK